jgi:hypothetical protein
MYQETYNMDGVVDNQMIKIQQFNHKWVLLLARCLRLFLTSESMIRCAL